MKALLDPPATVRRRARIRARITAYEHAALTHAAMGDTTEADAYRRAADAWTAALNYITKGEAMKDQPYTYRLDGDGTVVVTDGYHFASRWADVDRLLTSTDPRHHATHKAIRTDLTAGDRWAQIGGAA